MDSQEREAFWNVLCSLSGNDVKQDAEKLMQAIRFP